MITTTEIRIGNWILDDDLIPSKIIGLSPFDDSVRCDQPEGCKLLVDLYARENQVREGLECESNEAHPIVLTQKVLHKAGFEIKSRNDYWNFSLLNGWTISMWMELGNPGGFEEMGSCYWGENYILVQYLHQLQNLYHATTGSELTYLP